MDIWERTVTRTVALLWGDTRAGPDLWQRIGAACPPRSGRKLLKATVSRGGPRRASVAGITHSRGWQFLSVNTATNCSHLHILGLQIYRNTWSLSVSPAHMTISCKDVCRDSHSKVIIDTAPDAGVVVADFAELYQHPESHPCIPVPCTATSQMVPPPAGIWEFVIALQNNAPPSLRIFISVAQIVCHPLPLYWAGNIFCSIKGVINFA